MSFVKFDFLNWRPDLEDYRNEGLVSAQNILHQPEGYKQITALTTTSMGTIASVAFDKTATSIQMRQVGPNKDAETIANMVYGAAARNAGGTAIAVVASGAGSTVAGIQTGSVLATTTSGVVKCFQVCELNDIAFVAFETQHIEPGGTLISLNQSAYSTMTFS
jgi:hypothetical protein